MEARRECGTCQSNRSQMQVKSRVLTPFIFIMQWHYAIVHILEKRFCHYVSCFKFDIVSMYTISNLKRVIVIKKREKNLRF